MRCCSNCGCVLLRDVLLSPGDPKSYTAHFSPVKGSCQSRANSRDTHLTAARTRANAGSPSGRLWEGWSCGRPPPTPRAAARPAISRASAVVTGASIPAAVSASASSGTDLQRLDRLANLRAGSRRRERPARAARRLDGCGSAGASAVATRSPGAGQADHRLGARALRPRPTATPRRRCGRRRRRRRSDPAPRSRRRRARRRSWRRPRAPRRPGRSTPRTPRRRG